MPESRPVLEEALDPVDGLGRRDRVEPGARDPRDLADADRQVLRHPLVVEPAVDEQVGEPDTGQLRALLLERHPPEQLVDVHDEKSSCSASRRISSASSARSQPSSTSSSSRRSNRST